jgi:hypothetical protein
MQIKLPFATIPSINGYIFPTGIHLQIKIILVLPLQIARARAPLTSLTSFTGMITPAPYIRIMVLSSVTGLGGLFCDNF